MTNFIKTQCKCPYCDAFCDINIVFSDHKETEVFICPVCDNEFLLYFEFVPVIKTKKLEDKDG